MAPAATSHSTTISRAIRMIFLRMAGRCVSLPADAPLQSGEATALRPRFIKVTARCGDVKAVEIAAAKAAPVRRISRQRVGLEHGAARREHIDQRAGTAALPTGAGHDVAVG